MKARIGFLMFAFAMLLALCACGSTSVSESEKTPDAPEQSGASGAAAVQQVEAVRSFPIFPDSPLAEEQPEGNTATVLYRFTASDDFYADNQHLVTNSSVGWAYECEFDGSGERFYTMQPYNNTNSEGGLPKNEKLTVTLAEAPEIETAQYGGVQLSFRYVLYELDSDINVTHVNRLEVRVSTDHGKTWSEKTAGLRTAQLLGYAELFEEGEIKPASYYEITTEDLTALVPAGATITDIRFKPYGDFGQHWGAFRLAELSVVGYAKQLPVMKEHPLMTYAVGGETAREIVVDHIKKLATFSWKTDTAIETLNYNGTAASGKAYSLFYKPDLQYFGPVYTRSVHPSMEQILAEIVDGKYVGPTDSDHALGMDCATFVFDGISRVSQSYGWNGLYFQVEYPYSQLVAPLTDPDHSLANTTEVLQKGNNGSVFGKQTVFEAYANTLPGDPVSSFPKRTHIRICTKEPTVTYLSNGRIDGERSFLYLSEVSGSSAGAGTNGKFYTCRIDKEYSFEELYEMHYLSYTIPEYFTGEIAALDAIFATSRKAEDLRTKGLLGVMNVNYRIIDVVTTLTDTDSGETLYSDVRYLESRIRSYPYRNDELNEVLAALPADGHYELKIDAVTSGPTLTVGGEAPVTTVYHAEF